MKSPVARRALDRLERCERLADALELGLDLLVVDLRLAAPDLDALVLAELRRRHHADLDREGERGALLRQVVEVHLRVADGLDAGVRDRLLVPARQAPPDGLVEHRLAAHLLEHDLRRHLAAAEAGHAHLASELGRGGLQLALERLGRDLHLHAHARVRKLRRRRLYGGRHWTRDCSGVSVVWCAGPPSSPCCWPCSPRARSRAGRPPRRRRRAREAAKRLNTLVRDTRKLPKRLVKRRHKLALVRLAKSAKRTARRRPCRSVRTLRAYRRQLKRVKRPRVKGRAPTAGSRRGQLESDTLAANVALLALPRARRCGGGAG